MAFQEAPTAEVQVLSTLQERGVEKVTYQIGGHHLVLPRRANGSRPSARDWEKSQRPQYRETCFRVRATIILDTARQTADAARRERRIRAYEGQLDWVRDHLNKGQYYGDPEWVAGHLADLAHDFKDVRTLVQVRFQKQDGGMSLTYHRRPERVAQAARLDGKWVLVGNQPLEPGQSEEPIMFIRLLLVIVLSAGTGPEGLGMLDPLAAASVSWGDAWVLGEDWAEWMAYYRFLHEIAPKPAGGQVFIKYPQIQK